MKSMVTCHGRKLAYELIEAVPPWRQPAETLIFHHEIAVDRHLLGANRCQPW